MGKILSSGGGNKPWPGFDVRFDLPKLARGASGMDVIYLERCLKVLGFLQREPLGSYDATLESAVRDFQKKYKLGVDGVTGTLETWPKIYELIRAGMGESAPALPPASSRPVNPAYTEAKKYDGWHEAEARTQKKFVPYWKRVGLPSFGTLVGTSFAWCALFIFAVNSDVGQRTIASALARDHAKFGVEYNWKRDGIPRGAVMHLNHNGNCSSGSGNHVTFADADCAPQDLIEMAKGADGIWRAKSNPPKLKASAVVPGFGGNQGNMVKRSIYPVREVCAVRWPHEVALPPPVTVSIGCNGSSSGESTR